jgi:Zn-finger nucleic acid-binding protein
MKCPNCNETLLMTERNNIEIDYCPSCRGIWLDKGELDKMLEYAEEKYKSAGQPQNQQNQNQQHNQQTWQKYDNDHYKNDHHKYNPHHQKPHKKKGFLGDLFDFD